MVAVVVVVVIWICIGWIVVKMKLCVLVGGGGDWASSLRVFYLRLLIFKYIFTNCGVSSVKLSCGSSASPRPRKY
jgi:hypothetical protein